MTRLSERTGAQLGHWDLPARWEPPAHGARLELRLQRKAWRDAFSQLAASQAERPLPLDDLELLAQAAYLCGEDAASGKAWTEANQRSVEEGDWARAARCAFWLGVTLQARSERAQAGGWFARAQRVLDDNDHDCTERGWLQVVAGLKLHHERQYETSEKAWLNAIEIGRRFEDTDLQATARQGLGRILIKQGRISEGAPMLDEAMVAVLADEVSPIPAGIIYCSVIEACQEILDIARAQEWTAALSDWVDAQPDLVPYRGRCQIHRSEIMALGGRWPDAAAEVAQACEQLADPPQPQLGMALYQQAEIHRLRGEFDAAEAAYQAANEKAFVLQPGFALLKLAQGQTDAAVAAIKRAFEATSKTITRCRVLPAYVEIMLASGDFEAAASACDELAAIAEALDSPLLRGVAVRSKGALLVEKGDAKRALEVFSEAWGYWSELEAPYEVARLRVLSGIASQKQGDDHSAASEFKAARRAFEQLGAATDLKALDELTGTPPSEPPGGLSPREVEILTLVARGKSNREIASELVISERTVARHMSNIFAKLDVTSRTAATAFAFENDLV
jgi:DNA-binding CsgD family transcriptional regulator